MQFTKDLITINEVENDGKTIHLYFNTQIGLYVAYGFSAFFTAHIVDVISSFSEELQMPVALLKKASVNELRLSCNKIQHDYHVYYHLELKNPLGLDDYPRWVESVKWK